MTILSSFNISLCCPRVRFCSVGSFTSHRSLHLTADTAVAYHHVKFTNAEITLRKSTDFNWASSPKPEPIKTFLREARTESPESKDPQFSFLS